MTPAQRIALLTDEQLWNIVEDTKAAIKAGRTLSEYAHDSLELASDELYKRGWV